MEIIIKIEKLNKTFGEIKAVNDLSFEVRKGEFFAFLGVNGAGKSTTISIICGQLSRDSGEVYVCGQDISKAFETVSKEIGVVFQNSVLDQPLTVIENLKYRAGLYGIKGKELEDRIEELSSMLDLKPLLKRTVGKLSGGQKRRVDIARALIHKPKILILDEPTTGLDPQTRKMLWDVITKLRKERQMTVFLTTHYMEETSDADYVVILDNGNIVAKGTPIELKNKYTGDYITFYNLKEEEIKQLNLPYDKIADGFRVEVETTKQATELILNNPNLFSDYEITKGKMDDVFLSVTGKKLVGGNE